MMHPYMETSRSLNEGDTPAHTGLWSVVLGAGAGSRFGGDKMRAPWAGGRLVEAAIATARSAPVDGVILVTRPGDRLVDDPALKIVEAADWATGMAASLRAGIAALPAGAAGAYVFLGDMPDRKSVV